MVSQQIREEIEKIVGPENIVGSINVPEVHDMVYFPGIKLHKPSFAVLPGSTDEVSQILKLANSGQVHVVPWGGGTTRYNGAVLAPEDSIIVCTQRMTKIIDMDETDHTATVQAGITVASLNRELRKRNLWWPHDPESKENATIGGCVSLDGTGTYYCKYGTARDMTLAVKIVVPDGRVIKAGRRVAHSLVGYDLVKLFTGTLGTLGIVTEVTLRLDRLPETRVFNVLLYDNIEIATKACASLIDAGLRPEVLFIEDSIRFYYNIVASKPLLEKRTKSLLESTQALVMIAFSGSKELVKSSTELALAMFTKSGGKILQDEDVKAAWWQTKTSLTFEIPEELKGGGTPPKIGVADVAIPMATLPYWNAQYREVTQKNGLFLGGLRAYVSVNHELGLSPVVLFNDSNREEVAGYMRWIEELSKLSVDVGGTMTFNTGLGTKLSDFADYELGEATQIVRMLKYLIDPRNIMNRGKMSV